MSVTFTWDIAEGERLAAAWGHYYDTVRLGGPAFGDCKDAGHLGNEFVSGRYVRPGITFTTRGCNNNCPWCVVPEREGPLVELPNFSAGNIVQDNNLLQASRQHLRQVSAMLHAQKKGAVFSGGLQADLVDAWVASWLEGIRVGAVFLAADTRGALPALRQAVDKLKFLGLRSNKMRCYVLIGYGNETIAQATERLDAVWEIGCLPFAQLFQPPETEKKKWPQEWKDLARTWSRPAAIRAMHKEKTNG